MDEHKPSEGGAEAAATRRASLLTDRSSAASTLPAGMGLARPSEDVDMSNVQGRVAI